MTVAGPVAPPSQAAEGRRTHHVGVFGILLRKELRESAGALIAGLAIYWAMPAFLELLYIAVDSKHEWLWGIAWVFLLLTGWLYAIVVGAHTVCRDWGKAEGHFLLARPVSPRTVIWAKLTAGILVVAIVGSVGSLWDWSLHILSEPGQGSLFSLDGEWTWIWGVLISSMTISFVMAFAVAVLSRQMLPSVLLPVLVLVIWSTAPLISGRLGFLYLFRIVEQVSVQGGGHSLPLWLGPLAGVHFAGLVGLCIVASLGAAFLSCTSERGIRLGHKPLAWAMAVTVLALFAAAMDEVGNSLKVRDAHSRLCDKPVNHDPACVSEILLAAISSDDCVFTLSKRMLYEGQRGDNGLAGLSLHSYELRRSHVDREGRVQESRYVDIRDLVKSEYENDRASSIPPEQLWWDYDPGLVIASRSPDDIIFVASALGDTFRVRLEWPEGESPKIVSISELAQPRDAGFSLSHQQLSTARFTYLVHVVSPTSQQVRQGGAQTLAQAPRLLQVVDWSDESDPEVSYTIPLPPGTNIALKQDCLVFAHHQYDDWEVEIVPVDDPDVLAALQANPSRLFKPGPSPWSRTVQPFHLLGFRRFGPIEPSAWTFGGDGTLYVSDALGLRVFGLDELGNRTVIGQCWRSPLSLMFSDYVSAMAEMRSYYWKPGMYGASMMLVSDSLLIEPGLTTYDVSDPTKPRRSGFLSAVERSLAVLATPRHLVLCGRSSILVVDRPRQ